MIRLKEDGYTGSYKISSFWKSFLDVKTSNKKQILAINWFPKDGSTGFYAMESQRSTCENNIISQLSKSKDNVQFWLLGDCSGAKRSLDRGGGVKSKLKTYVCTISQVTHNTCTHLKLWVR